jgi:DNA-binding MarR family transcriptional regulator
VTTTVAKAIKQQRKFTSLEEEVHLALRLVTARMVEPWERFLKTHADLSPNQYNVLRILRGSHPSRLPSGEIASRMLARDPDITRLIDRLLGRELVERVRSEEDRRVVEVGITAKGLELVGSLDVHVTRMPKAMLGGLGRKNLVQLSTLLDQLLGTLGTFP